MIERIGELVTAGRYDVLEDAVRLDLGTLLVHGREGSTHRHGTIPRSVLQSGVTVPQASPNLNAL